MHSSPKHKKLSGTSHRVLIRDHDLVINGSSRNDDGKHLVHSIIRAVDESTDKQFQIWSARIDADILRLETDMGTGLPQVDERADSQRVIAPRNTSALEVQED